MAGQAGYIWNEQYPDRITPEETPERVTKPMTYQQLCQGIKDILADTFGLDDRIAAEIEVAVNQVPYPNRLVSLLVRMPIAAEMIFKIEDFNEGSDKQQPTSKPKKVWFDPIVKP